MYAWWALTVVLTYATVPCHRHSRSSALLHPVLCLDHAAWS